MPHGTSQTILVVLVLGSQKRITQPARHHYHRHCVPSCNRGFFTLKTSWRSPLIRDFALHPRGDMAAEGEFWQFVDEVGDGGKNVTGGERGPSV